MKRKWIGLFLSAVMAMTAFTGCGTSDNGGNDTADTKDESTSSDSDDSEKIVLEFFNQKVEAESLYNDVIIPKFQEEHPNRMQRPYSLPVYLRTISRISCLSIRQSTATVLS